MRSKVLVPLTVLLLVVGLPSIGRAQSTTFTYQGALNTSGSPANGNHDFEFAMFNGGGVQIGSTLTRSNVAVTNGSFSVELDFGNQFQGADRFLEIRLRPAGGGAFTTLTPRTLITSTPHAIRSLDSAQLGGVSANQYVVSGATSINAATQFNIGGSRVLAVPGNGNTFLGLNTGTANTGARNSFFGNGAGAQNTASLDNSFFGFISGGSNTTGSGNAFFGSNSGGANTTGAFNTFLGAGSGSLNTTGTRNVYVGTNSGTVSTTGNDNTFVGHNSGAANTTASLNTFVGKSAGELNTTGQSNSFYGAFAGGKTTIGSFNSFFGKGAGFNNTSGGNNSFFGDGAGGSNTTGSENSFFGTGAGTLNTGSRNSFFGNGAGAQNTTGLDNSFFGHQAGGFNGAGSNNTFAGSNAGLFNTGSNNSFFGQRAGQDNTAGNDNSMFGNLAGENTTTGNRNSFFGVSSGAANTTGEDNSFFGSFAGQSNTTATGNVFIGKDAGRSNTTAGSNTFVGTAAGLSNTIGTGNAFFGHSAGNANVSGSNNAFFGRSAGASNTTGANNSFFGPSAGLLNTTGQNNSIFGTNAGLDNTSGSNNAIFGTASGVNNTTGSSNSVFGFGAADGNTIGIDNSYFGARSNSADGLINATAIGSRAFVTSNNSLVLGSINGVNGATANARIGIGTTAPINRLTIGEPETPILNGAVGIFNTGGTFLTVRDTTNDIEGFVGADSNGVLFGSISNSIVRIRTNNVNRLTFDASGNAIFSGIVSFNSFAAVETLDTGGSTALCRNASLRISTCSSSMRYKTNVNPFRSGVDLVKRLRPITFDWKDGGMHDLGLGAEDVAAIEPLLVTYNKSGQVEGVKYDRVGVVLINAVKEQQAEIERQAAVIRRQQEQIDALARLVCATNKSADICKAP